MRVEQPRGARGSLKWIQRAVNENWPSLNGPISDRVQDAPITWLSPLIADNLAEYRGGAFVTLLGHSSLEAALAEYWPARGPQWDALGKTSRGDLLLVEAKAHIAELCSPGTTAGTASRERINNTFEALALELGAAPKRANWSDYFYQLANRLAHLQFFRKRGIPAWLVLVGFLGDREMGGPTTSEAWEAAYKVAFHVMGLPPHHALASYIVHVYPRVLPDREARPD